MKTQPAQAIRNFLFQDKAKTTGDGEELIVTDQAEGAYETLTIQITGTFVGTVTFEGSIDGVNYVSLLASDVTTGATATTTTAAGIFRVDVTGLYKVRMRVSAWTSGAITVLGNLTA
jgi:hypothetical protein